MNDLPTCLLAAITEREAATEHESSDSIPSDCWGPSEVRAVCAAHRRIVARYTEAIEWAAKAAPAGGLRSATAEVRVHVLAEILDDLAAVYGVAR